VAKMVETIHEFEPELRWVEIANGNVMDDPTNMFIIGRNPVILVDPGSMPGLGTVVETLVQLGNPEVAAILLTLAAGWRQACAFSDVHAQAGEVPMTERLRDGMRCALKSKMCPWRKTLIVLPGTESRSSSGVSALAVNAPSGVQ
jgi:hypothetical protein